MPATVAELEARLAAVEQRLAALEGSTTEQPDYDPESASPSLGEGFAASASTHIGRVLLIFGGAYLLRAITDFEFVPVPAGLLMGAVYAVFWLWMAFRHAVSDGGLATATFFGGTSVLLALPLLHESVTHFALLTGVQGVVALAAYSGLALTVAVARDLKILAWIATAGGIAAAIAALIASHVAVSVAVFLLLLGLGTLWIEYWRDWLGFRWLGALGANLGALALVALAQSDRWSIAPQLPVIFAVILLTAFLLSFSYHTHIRRQLVSLFESVQAMVAAVIVLVSVISAVRGGFLDIKMAGGLALLLGVGGYGLSLAREMRAGLYRNFFYYSSFGLVFVLAGTVLLLPPSGSATVWALMAIMMAWFSGRTGWVSLSMQCTILLTAASAGSGLLSAGQQALAGDPLIDWVSASPVFFGIAAAMVACLLIPVAQKSDRWGRLAGLPQLIVLVLSVWCVGGLIIAVSAPLVAGVGQTDPNLGLLATIRTVVLSAASVALALSSRHWRWPEARWLVYPVLVLTGIKLFIEDFPNGQPATLFVSLAFVGTALLLTARFLKRENGGTKAAPS